MCADWVPIFTLPFSLITNLFRPDEEAVKRSPRPELLITKLAKLVLPEKEAIGRVFEVPRTSSLAEMVAVLIPTLPAIEPPLVMPRKILPLVPPVAPDWTVPPDR